jgi:sulfite reductase (NADPH) flavoprotein alpha-component
MAQSSNPADESGLSPEQLDALGVLAGTLSPAQHLLAVRWLLGRFDAGALLEERFETGAVETTDVEGGLTILYGSQTGHAASVAKGLATRAQAKGWSVTLSNLADVSRSDFKRVRNLALVVSTHGEGEPPESAQPAFEYLNGSRAQPFGDCAFAVLGLGDRSYVHFCKAAADFDARFAGLGATRLLDRVELDVDYKAGSEEWTDAVLTAFASRVGAQSVTPRVTVGSRRPTKSSRYDRENPWQAEVLDKVVVSGKGSIQHFVHLELSLEGSNIKYQPGDALGVAPQNDPEYVEQLLERLGQSADVEVTIAGEKHRLREALQSRLEIRLPSVSAVNRYAALGNAKLQQRLTDVETARAFLAERDWLDVLSEFPVDISLSDFVSLLPELSSRSYSIASSQRVHSDEVHLLVSRVGYTAQARTHRGVASGFLADRVKPGDKLAVWIEPNRHFRLPTDPSVPLVLIGAGTGIAPYRAFIEERAACGASGKHWVVFGNRSFRTDFTYQSEWLKLRDRGALARMDVAFSRDQPRKVYVTDKLRDQGERLYEWLENGASVYLCGDRAKLSAAVDQALLDAVVEHGDKSVDVAKAYLEQLSASGRYRKDVY